MTDTSSLTVTFSIECFKEWSPEQKRLFMIEHIMGALIDDSFEMNIENR